MSILILNIFSATCNIIAATLIILSVRNLGNLKRLEAQINDIEQRMSRLGIN